MKRPVWILTGAVGVFLAASLLAWSLDYAPGMRAAQSFAEVVSSMLLILPAAFVLIALFEQWVDNAVVERHLGQASGWRGYAWAVVLASMSIGGLYVALPLAAALRKKGASLAVLFSYLGCAGVCRIPMTLFEISCLGLPFTALRLGCGLSLALISGALLGHFLEGRGFTFRA